MSKYNNVRFGQIKKVALFWQNNPQVTLKNATVNDLKTNIDFVTSSLGDLDTLEQRKRELLKRRDEAYTAAAKIATRLGKQVLADDPDSSDVKELGFVPTSERKSPTRKPKA